MALTTQQCALVLETGRRWLTTSSRRQSKLVLDACGSATGHATPMVTREPMESFNMSHPMDQIDNSRTKPPKVIRLAKDLEASSLHAVEPFTTEDIATLRQPAKLRPR